MKEGCYGQEKTLTPEQREFAERNHGLVFAFLNENKLPEEDYYDVVVFGYLDAVYDYHTDPELIKYEFSTICWRKMRGALSNHYKTQLSKKRTAEVTAIFDLPQRAMSSASAHNEQMIQMEIRLLLHDLALTLSKQQMQIVELKCQGYGVREIAGKLNVTVKQVRRLLAQTRDALIELCYGCRLTP